MILASKTDSLRIVFMGDSVVADYRNRKYTVRAHRTIHNVRGFNAFTSFHSSDTHVTDIMLSGGSAKPSAQRLKRLQRTNAMVARFTIDNPATRNMNLAMGRAILSPCNPMRT